MDLDTQDEIKDNPPIEAGKYQVLHDEKVETL